MADSSMAAYSTLDEVLEDFENQWHAMDKHPIEFLREKVRTGASKQSLASALIPHMLNVNPDFPKHVVNKIDLGRALQVKLGYPGEVHVLMLGFEKVRGTRMDAFWRGEPSSTKIKEWLWKSLRETLDTTQKSLKLVVSKSACEGAVNDKLFFTGYAGGSSVGVAQTLGCYMLLQTEKHCLQVPEVQAWLKSLTSIKVNFVVHEDSFSRLFDSIGSRS